MRVVITGAGGMLGQALLATFDKSHDVIGFSRSQLDVTSWEQVSRTLLDLRPDWVLHAAAFTAVDDAEEKVYEALRVNALGARHVAAAAHRCGAGILYYSTDYVFDGQAGDPYPEWAPCSPINAYGLSKRVGEEWVQRACPRHLIVRTSWLYGPGGPNFVEKIAALAQRGEPLRVVEDQLGSPTLTIDLSQHSLLLVEKDLSGLFHVTNSGACTWCDFAREIVRCLGLDLEVRGVPSSQYPTPAKRPSNSVLENWCLAAEGLPLMRNWRRALSAYMELRRG